MQKEQLYCIIKEMNDKETEYEHEIHKVQTLASGGVRVTIDIPEIHAPQATWLFIQSQKTGVYFRSITKVVEAEFREDFDKSQHNARKVEA